MNKFNFIILVMQCFVAVTGMVFAVLTIYRLLVTQGNIFIILCFMLILVLGLAMLVTSIREIMQRRPK